MALVNKLQRDGVLRTPALVKAFNEVRREDFFPEQLKANAEIDYAFPIGYGQTISQPWTVAFMLEQLDLKAGQKILDVGSGSGWTTALLAQITGSKGSVVGVERVSELVKFGSDNVSKYRFKNASIRQSASVFGWPDGAPYDRILVSAEAVEIPEELVEQLKDGGVMVLPVGHSIHKVVKSKNRLDITEHPGFIFVPLVQ